MTFAGGLFPPPPKLKNGPFWPNEVAQACAEHAKYHEVYDHRWGWMLSEERSQLCHGKMLQGARYSGAVPGKNGSLRDGITVNC